MKILAYNDVTFSARSIDPIGVIFYYNNRIFRKISPEYKEKTLSLLNSDIFKILIKKKYFVNTWVSEYSFEDGALVLEHEKVFAIPPKMWTFSMLKDCACFALELNSLLRHNNLMLKDGHTGNFTFIDNKPIFFDFGSIIELSSNNYNFFYEFLYYFIYPLLLYANHEESLGKLLLSTYSSGASSNFLKTMFIKFMGQSSNIFLKFLAQAYGVLPSNKFFYKTKREIERLFRRRFRKNFLTVSDIKKIKWEKTTTEWGDYYNGLTLNNNERFNNVINYIKTFCSSSTSIVDIAGNQGLLALMINNELPFIKRKINLDYDEVAIDKSYIYIYEKKISGVTTLLNDVMTQNLNIINSVKSDIVFAMAVTHHLILSQHYSIDEIFSIVKSYSNKYVFVEFMPLGLWNGHNNPTVPDWYTFDWFKTNFEKYFKIIKIDHYEKNRILFIGEIIE